jgi:hypothetical protein
MALHALQFVPIPSSNSREKEPVIKNRELLGFFGAMAKFKQMVKYREPKF